MAMAKQAWFNSIIDSLINSGLNKIQIAEKLSISTQRLTNLLNGSDPISDKVIDTFVLSFNMRKITLHTQSNIDLSAPVINEEKNKEETALERLGYYLLLCGITEEQAIVNARLEADTLKNIREEDKDLTEKEIIAFTQTFPDLNEEWLRTGKGNMRNGNALPIENRKQPMARILQLLNEEDITLEEFARLANSKAATFNRAYKWPNDSRSLILGNDKAIWEWVNVFCNLFPKYSKVWILTGKTSKYNYPVREEE